MGGGKNAYFLKRKKEKKKAKRVSRAGRLIYFDSPNWMGIAEERRTMAPTTLVRWLFSVLFYDSGWLDTTTEGTWAVELFERAQVEVVSE
jgi:hypothetical protein